MQHEAHLLADAQSPYIGPTSSIWQSVVVLPNVRIGAGCNICVHMLGENDVIISDRATVKSGVQPWDGLRIEDYVFISPNVTFTNYPFPRGNLYLSTFPVTTVKTGAPIWGGGNPYAGHKGRAPRHGKRWGCNYPVGVRWRLGGGQPSAHRALREVGR